ncbi:CENP-B protein, partial [Atractiella rhizophila]
MKRHPEFANRVARRIGKERINISYQELEKWWEELGKACEEYGIVDADQVNCVDEKGFMLGVSQKEHVVMRRKDQVKNPQFNTVDGNHEWVTVIECINASGKAANPMIIFAGKNFMKSWMEGRIKTARYAKSESGWTDDELGHKWLAFFEEENRRPDRKWQLLLMDGHGSHLTFSFLRFALAHYILPFVLIPHTSHLTSPLDVAIFSFLQLSYSRTLDNELRERRDIKKNRFSYYFREARKNTYTPDRIKKAFEVSRMWPVD